MTNEVNPSTQQQIKKPTKEMMNNETNNPPTKKTDKSSTKPVPMKQCPFCLADVPEAAVKCRYCASDFRGSISQQVLSKAGDAFQVAKNKSGPLFERGVSPIIKLLSWLAPRYEIAKTTAKSASEVTINDITLLLAKRHKFVKDAEKRFRKRLLLGLGLLPILFAFLDIVEKNRDLEFIAVILLLVGAGNLCLFIPWYLVRLIVAWSERKGIHMYIEHIAEQYPQEASFFSVATKEALPRIGSWLIRQTIKRVLREVERELLGE